MNASPSKPHSSQNSSCLDLALPWAIRLLVLFLLCLVPCSYVARHYDARSHFTSLILFSKKYEERSLPEIRAMHPPLDPGTGYDGQFYAQIALDPTLQRPELAHAMYNPTFRAQRIFLPALAYAVGLGQPVWVVNAYALLNLAFWFLLLAGLVYFLRIRTLRDHLCVAAILLSTGSLISVEWSLTDLPAATLGFYAIVLGGTSSWVLMTLSMLTKPTSALFLLKHVWPWPRTRAEALRRAIPVAVVLSIPVLWNIYLTFHFGVHGAAQGNLGLPLKAWLINVYREAGELFSHHGFDSRLLFEFLAPLSLMAQALYFWIFRDFSCPHWRIGAGFTLLFLCLAQAVFDDQIGLTRCVLPMTIAFNILLRNERGNAFLAWFVAGNAGLFWLLSRSVGQAIGV